MSESNFVENIYAIPFETDMEKISSKLRFLSCSFYTIIIFSGKKPTFFDFSIFDRWEGILRFSA